MVIRRGSPFGLLVIAVAGFFAALVALTSQADAAGVLGVLPDVADGETVGAQLDDGTPVYVHRQGEQRYVLGAISPRSYLLVWCDDVPGFIEPGSAFSFDARGRFLFGGEPHGMFRYAARAEDGEISVLRELLPTPRYDFGGFGSANPNNRTCFESEGSVGGLYHPVAADPVAVGDLPFDGGWHAVEGFLDLTSEQPRLCPRPVDEQCPAVGDAVVPVTTLFGMRSPVMDDFLPGSYDGIFVGRATPGGVFTDLAIVQRLLDVEAARNGQWLYQTRYIEDSSSPNPLLPDEYVLGEVETFTRRRDHYELRFRSAAFVQADTGDLVSQDGDEPAPAHWRVSARIDLVGIYDNSEGSPRWLMSPDELMRRIRQEPVVVAGHLDDDRSGNWIVDLYVHGDR